MSSVAVVNTGAHAPSFAAHASRLAAVLWAPERELPAERCLLLGWDDTRSLPEGSFVPATALHRTADAAALVDCLESADVPVVETTRLADRPDEPGWREARDAHGHRFARRVGTSPRIERAYGAGGRIVGVHALGTGRWIDTETTGVARAALEAVGLLGSFGRVDVLVDGGELRVVDVATDGPWGFVPREPWLEDVLDRAIAEAFWAPLGRVPWGTRGYRRRGQRRVGAR